MKRRYIITLLASLVFGITVTLLSIAQMSWKSAGDCADVGRPLPVSIRKVECSGMTYGFPLRFIASHPHVELEYMTDIDNNLAILESTATTSLSVTKLTANILFWTALCATTAVVGGKKLTGKKPKGEHKSEPEEEK